MSPGIKVIFAVLTGLAASALARLSYGPSPVDTYTSGFIYWLNYYSGFYFGVPVAAIVWLGELPGPRPSGGQQFAFGYRYSSRLSRVRRDRKVNACHANRLFARREMSAKYQ